MGLTTANLAWNGPSNAAQWEVIVQPSTFAAPVTTSAGTIVTSSTFQATELNLGTAYKFYVRAICSETATLSTPTTARPSRLSTGVLYANFKKLNMSCSFSNIWSTF